MGIREEHYIIICGNPPPDYALAVFTVTIKLTMHVVAIVLALRTRNIEVDAVNDAKETQAIVYTSTVLILAILVFSLTLEGYPNAYGIALGTCVYLGCLMFLGFTFIPKASSIGI